MGTEGKEDTISQHYYWFNTTDEVRTLITVCINFQKKRKQNFRCGNLPTKEAEATPQDILSVDIIGAYKIRKEGHDDPLILKALTMIDPTTGWSEILRYNNKQVDKITNLVDQTWLCRYPCPTIIVYNQRNELLGHAFKNDLI